MRKLFPLAILAAGILVACGGGDKKEPGKKDAGTTAATETNNISSNPDYTPGLELVSRNDCLTCHRTSGKLTGPSYEEVAAKYAGADDKKIEALAKTIIDGVMPDKGVWGTNQAMTPHPGVSLDDAKKMVKYILLLKK